jgi:hypothetical protein
MILIFVRLQRELAMKNSGGKKLLKSCKKFQLHILEIISSYLYSSLTFFTLNNFFDINLRM